MFAVIFTVQPRSGHFDEYLGLAGSLRPELEKIDGFIDNERFASRRQEGRILSLSIWRDEKAVIRWRTLGAHHHVQERGRSAVFADYHLRVGEIVADTGLSSGQALAEQRLDETETGAAKAATISELAAGAAPAGPTRMDLAAALGLPAVGARGLVDGEVFESITHPGKLLLLALWQDADAGRWQPKSPAAGALRHRRVRIIRDYGMSDRREAPQYYPPAPRND